MQTGVIRYVSRLVRLLNDLQLLYSYKTTDE